MSAAATSRGARRFVAAGLLFLVLWQVAAVTDVPRGTEVGLGLLGFVFCVLFGKAYALVPSYFVRDLAFPRAPTVQLPLSAAGALGIALVPLPWAPGWVGTVGSLAWLLGVAVFLGTVGWTIRGNPTGRETGTSDANVDRRPVDRAANAAVPVALAYLALGSYELAALHGPLPPLLGAPPSGTTHLLAAGTAALFVFAVGFRLLPRFLVAAPPRALVWVVLPAGALGPILLASSFLGGARFVLGAALEAVAVTGFALAYAVLFLRSDRRRVGFYGVLSGAVAGALGVGLGLMFATAGLDPTLVPAHYRLNLLGFLGLTIVGVAYQFYPPAVGTFPSANDRTALGSIGAVFAGLLVELGGHAAGSAAGIRAGRAMALVGAAVVAWLVLGLFLERDWGGR